MVLPTTLQAETPFRFETTPGKLPRTQFRKSYDIHITPNIEKLTFTGSETVDVDLRKAAKTITLNANALTISSAKVVDGRGKTATRAGGHEGRRPNRYLALRHGDSRAEVRTGVR